MWDVQKAVKYLNEHAEASSKGYCARYVKAAISAGGDISRWPSIVSAKDYGPALLERGFEVIPSTNSSLAGDVVIIQGINKEDFAKGEINKDHPHGHMAMFNGQHWVSDFKQSNGFYPGGDYRKAKPAYVFYRHKDADGQSSEEHAAPDNAMMKTCFPARKKNSENYTTLDEMMDLIGKEQHGSWLAGTNRMWHGGIHISEKSAPGSILNAEMMDAAVPLQCMADGEVVAWRLNQDYKTGTYNNQTLQYSTTFVLVKSICKPDPQKENTWLEFYSLYMGLAPLSAFQKCKCMKAKSTVMKRKADMYESSQQGKKPSPAPVKEGDLVKGSRILVLRETTFLNGSEPQPFGLAQELDKNGKTIGKTFWVSLLKKYMEPDGEQYALLPVWMQKAVEKGTFDAVVKPATTLNISAGEAIGFLGDDIVPVGMGQVSGSTYVHIEVLSTDSRMPDFLDNPGAVTSGRKYIRIKPDSKLYTKSDDTFRQTSTMVGKDIHAVLPEDKCNPNESGGKKYYQISENSWLSQNEVEEFNQYDLRKLGFSALVQESTLDMTASLMEGWVKSTFETISGQVAPERGIQQQQVSDFYKAMAAKLDSDQDGELSVAELYNAVHHPEMGIRDIAARLAVKHVSEWFGGSSDPKWSRFFETYDPLRKAFVKKWLDDVEWMSQVEPFTSGKAVWHMHPVMFLDALDDRSKVKCSFCSKGIEIIPELLIHCYGISVDKAAIYAPLLANAFSKYEINNCLRISHFLGQVGVETQMLTKLKEGFYYTDGDRLWRIYYTQLNIGLSKRFPSYTEAQRKQYTKDHLIRNEDELAKTLFPSEYEGMDYRGRGLIHLTHESTYRKYKEYSGNDVVLNPKLLEQDPAIAVDSACWFWSKFASINALADVDNLNMLTYAVNTARLDMDKRGEIKKLAFDYISKNNKWCNK